MKKVLLHICCGVCALNCVEQLTQNGFYVEGFYFNPNIHPEEEYEKRKEAVKRLSNIFALKVIEGKYNPEEWFKVCRPYSSEPEGGQRCFVCYRIRLEETLRMAESSSFDFFTTTLTMSPHKDSKTVFELAAEIGKDKFLAIDFKKHNGFKKTIGLAKKYEFYRQNYCGCIYSIAHSAKRKA